jgi:NADH dehydrogenase
MEDISFDAGTYAEALRLDKRLAELPRGPPSPSRSTIVVVGAGFTGIEVAAELSGRVARLGLPDARIMLIDSNPADGATIGSDA